MPHSRASPSVVGLIFGVFGCDKSTGRLLWEAILPAGGDATHEIGGGQNVANATPDSNSIPWLLLTASGHAPSFSAQ
ncbi:MAG TPA: hypothetical protein VME17_17720 [Bryobacteraceae bacterium]|nr:hypothetical protein [Bryobacteraceae bacterium]